MYLRKIQLVNYRKFEFAEVEFPDGVVGIIGNNGTGKSSLMEAIAWALFGNEAARTGKDEIKRSSASPSDICRVILDFQLEGENYEVVRELRGATDSADASILHNRAVVARGISASSEYIENLLNMDLRGFLSSFYAPQKELNMLSELTPARRKELLVRMLGIEDIEEAIKNLRQEKREEGAKLEAFQFQLQDKQELLVEKQKSEIKIANLKQVLDSEKEKIKNLENIFKLRNLEVENLKNKYETYNYLTKEKELNLAEIIALEKQSSIRQAQKEKLVLLLPELDKLKMEVGSYEKIKNSLEEYNELYANYQKRRQYEEQFVQQEVALKTDTQRLEQLLSVEPQKEKLADSISRLEEKKISLSTEIQRQSENRTQILYQMKSLKEQREKLSLQLTNIQKSGKDSVCDRCFRPLGDDFPRILQHLEEEIKNIENYESDLENKKNTLDKNLKQLETEKENLEKEYSNTSQTFKKFLEMEGEKRLLVIKAKQAEDNLSALKQILENLRDSQYDPQAHQNLKIDFENKTKLKEKLIQLTQETSRIPELEKDIQSVYEQKIHSEKNIRELDDKIRALSFAPQDYEAGLKELENMRKNMEEERMRVKDFEYEYKLAENQLKEVQEKLALVEKIEKEIKIIEENRLYLEKLDEILVNFKVHLIGRIRPSLSLLAKDLFLKMTEEKYEDLELDEDYEIFITEAGAKFSIERFSGGEKDLANLCLRIAISQLISQSSGVGFSFIILDEIFGSQDVYRKENILKTLNALKDQFRQIFLITHIDDIKDSVENLITVVEKDDFTSEIILQ